MNNLINTHLGQYQLTEVIGRGSTSTIYKGYQPSLDRYVAIKVLLRNLDPQFASRFKREAQAIAQLQHHNILPIYDYGQQEGLHYFVMQYIQNGSTLGDMISGQPLDPVTALRLMSHLLGALDYAHRRGIIHRDIKPSNILMPTPTWPMLADFGIAKLIDDSQHLTPVGQTVGTAAYMAPERADGRTADARTDLYSAGVVLYEMVTGRVPFDAATPVAVLMKHVYEPLPPPRSINPDLPAPIEAVLLRALEKDPDARYQSATEMAADVERAIVQIERALALTQLMQSTAGAPPPASTSSYTTRKLAPVDVPTNAAPSYLSGPSRKTFLVLVVPLVCGVIAVALLSGILPDATARTSQPDATQVVPTAVAAVLSAPTQAPAAPTEVPTEAPVIPTEAPAQAPVVPTEAPTEALEAPAQVPTEAPAVPAFVPPTPTRRPAPTPEPPVAVRPSQTQSGNATIRLEDTNWRGGYSRSGGSSIYGGRTATWIYGQLTDYNTMRAAIELPAQPVGTASLSIEGMDSEGRDKTPISIRINGVEIYNGPNPLPDDDQPLETGTWASYSWSFDTALLRPGRNEISITNLAPGTFSRPPFFMLDYADVLYTLP